MFSDNYSNLMEFLVVLAEHSAPILNWDTCGRVFHDFITLSGRMVTLQNAPVS